MPNFISEDQIELAVAQDLHHLHGFDVLRRSRRLPDPCPRALQIFQPASRPSWRREADFMT